MGKQLGEYQIRCHRFEDLAHDFQQFSSASFQQQSDWQKLELVSRLLLAKIQSEPEPAFLLPAVLEFIDRVNREQIVSQYTFHSFELWLNHFSSLSFEENYCVRAKIVGKRVQRTDYQILFPIGTGKIYEGSHFVTAHKSPDLDTTIASFWGWMDAFGARVSQGLHIWNVPGGPPSSQIEIQWLFLDLLHPSMFAHLAKTRAALNVTSSDLMTQKAFVRKKTSELLASVDHEREQLAVAILDEAGHFVGDWRSVDVEGVRQLILLVSSCLRWFENQLQLHLIAQFSKERLSVDEFTLALRHLFGCAVKQCEPALEFSMRQAAEVTRFMQHLLGLSQGLDASFEELRLHLMTSHMGTFPSLAELVEEVHGAQLFDAQGQLQENRPAMFRYVERVMQALHSSILAIRKRFETLDVALRTKSEIFGHQPTFLTLSADVEEMRAKMDAYSHLTVVASSGEMKMPVGVVHATDLRKSTLGTVSLRDFCNREEMTIPSYLEVISVIDHHKSSLSTYAPPLAVIADAQSSNTLIARLAFELNDRYSLGGQSREAVQTRSPEELSLAMQGKSLHLAERLLKRSHAAKNASSCYIHPDREFIEYLHFLYGILDDTDLLTKVTTLDLECVAALLNRLKSLAEGHEVELVSLDDLPRNRSFPRRAAQRLLQNEDLYSLYGKVYRHREKEVAESIQRAAMGQLSSFFADTKEQNGCCRVGQTKLFALNIPLYQQKAQECRRTWVHKAEEVYSKNRDIDLHVHMISTVVHGDEVYAGTNQPYDHQDELWIWAASSESGKEHLTWFVSSLQLSPGLKNQAIELIYLGERHAEWVRLFQESFPAMRYQETRHPDARMEMAIVRFQAGILNSRKAMISPFLPSI